MISDEIMDQAMWLEQAYASCSGLIDRMFFPQKFINKSFNEFKLRYSVKSCEETALYDWENLREILVIELGLNETELDYTIKYLIAKTYASAN